MTGQSLLTDSNVSAEDLVKDVLVKGACLNVSNVRAIGDNSGIGHYTFEGAPPVFKEGILLSTGFIHQAVGPNFSTNISGEVYGETTDRDLSLLATDKLFDVTGLEFDFVPFDSIVEFKFIFASEEYCEFVGSEFNDVFGFFVSGPGISGPFSNNAINVALLPGSDDYVAINTVNHLQRNYYYIGNETRNDATHCGIPYDPRYIRELQYDGFTRPLRARFRVQPCETYHIRLVVGDVADPILDSAVFLEARSFNLGGEVTVRTIVEEQDSSLVREGCSNAYFLFERVDQTENDRELTFEVTVDDLSTAQPGVDYKAIPGSLTIPAFADSLKLPVEVFLDGQQEGLENIQLALALPCECSSILAEFRIQDSSPLTARLPQQQTCRDTPTDIYVNASGGTGPYQYRWSTGETTESISLTAQTETTLEVRVTDACMQETTTLTTLGIIEPPAGLTADSITICDIRDDHTLAIDLFGIGPWSIHLNINGRDTVVSGITEAAYELPVTETGTYRLTAVTNNICTGEGQGTSIVSRPPLSLQLMDCTQTNSQAYEFVFSGEGTAEFSSDRGANFQAIDALTALEVGKPHRILIKDEAGCTNWQTVYLPASAAYQINVPDIVLKLGRQATFQPQLNIPLDFINSISWAPATDLNCTSCLTPTVTAMESRQYRINIEDAFGCVHSGVADLIVDIKPFFLPNAFSPFNLDGINDRLQLFVDETAVQRVQSFLIFDRWGNKVYERHDFLPDPDTGWDGTVRGRPVDPGVYIYYLLLDTADGRQRVYGGDISLIN